jgi:hypothetical protein
MPMRTYHASLKLRAIEIVGCVVAAKDVAKSVANHLRVAHEMKAISHLANIFRSIINLGLRSSNPWNDLYYKTNNHVRYGPLSDKL